MNHYSGWVQTIVQFQFLILKIRVIQNSRYQQLQLNLFINLYFLAMNQFYLLLDSISCKFTMYQTCFNLICYNLYHSKQLINKHFSLFNQRRMKRFYLLLMMKRESRFIKLTKKQANRTKIIIHHQNICALPNLAGQALTMQQYFKISICMSYKS
ncbi:transmembrane protein, putative (macronuclear) [Tetrahymena thermophila SB210]|uniref:Transmembrane protein, putative n=1 Tax=Tetrahymena thermophila (strain SB210) TaxID=312017 RepID=W7X3P6_TETTS|nr:transmembrane protein, putative [Tetrahymena thermophila SB210]EWS72077.1 transmembrane protein, putative [Tetrahymena thermophila SB210]|eukprot:XP_012655388.1 transmembrane protein, putative [Tetrahymena thermophila SB210]